MKKKEKKKEKQERKKKKDREPKGRDSLDPEDDKDQDDQGMVESNPLDHTHLITLTPPAEKTTQQEQLNKSNHIISGGEDTALPVSEDDKDSDSGLRAFQELYGSLFEKLSPSPLPADDGDLAMEGNQSPSQSEGTLQNVEINKS